MAVTSSTLRREGWTGSGVVGQGNKYTTEHLVESNSINDGPLSIALGALGSTPHPVPSMWAAYSVGNDYDNSVVVKNRSTRLHAYTKGGALWIVTTSYERPGDDTEEDAGGSNPLTRPIRYRVEWANYTKILYKDVTGKAIVNSAGQRFMDPMEVDDQRPVLVADKNVATLQEAVSLGLTYKNAVNTDTFYGAGPRQAKVQSITCGDQQVEENVAFRAMTIRVEFNEDKWDREVLDVGIAVKETEAVDSPLIVAKDAAGNPYGQEVNLAADGTILGDGEDALFKQPPFRVYPELSFSGLGI